MQVVGDNDHNSPSLSRQEHAPSLVIQHFALNKGIKISIRLPLVWYFVKLTIFVVHKFNEHVDLHLCDSFCNVIGVNTLQHN